ncbi:hypothetical protein GOODEAATRI_032790 [Goodea atripinnis]|uniref:Uncharacterized protein n=1 Tax=Goodea atripinnis TaxID=208336 RepID=A0ABV0PJ26_9TELE
MKLTLTKTNIPRTLFFPNIKDIDITLSSAVNILPHPNTLHMPDDFVHCYNTDLQTLSNSLPPSNPEQLLSYSERLGSLLNFRSSSPGAANLSAYTEKLASVYTRKYTFITLFSIRTPLTLLKSSLFIYAFQQLGTQGTVHKEKHYNDTENETEVIKIKRIE